MITEIQRIERVSVVAWFASARGNHEWTQETFSALIHVTVHLYDFTLPRSFFPPSSLLPPSFPSTLPLPSPQSRVAPSP